MNVPFVDLKAQYLSLKSEIDLAIQTVINETAFIGGKHVEAFQKAHAEKYGMEHCVSCANGTDAIYVTLKALSVGPGDEVITVANSWISTSETITQAGARPFSWTSTSTSTSTPRRSRRRLRRKPKLLSPSTSSSRIRSPRREPRPKSSSTSRSRRPQDHG